MSAVEQATDLAEHNREVLARRLCWPHGAVQDCRRIEAKHRHWAVWYDTGGLPRVPEPGYHAKLRHPAWWETDLRLIHPDAEGLGGLLTLEDARRARDTRLARWWLRL